MTIRELCNEVARTNKLDVSEAKIIEYQDMIAHEKDCELTRIANEPAIMEWFYLIYGEAYGTPAAIKFYMEHSDRIANMHTELDVLQQQVDDFRVRYKSLLKEKKYWEDLVETRNGQLKEAKRDMEGTLLVLEERGKENMVLKARLYDLEHKEG